MKSIVVYILFYACCIILLLNKYRILWQASIKSIVLLYTVYITNKVCQERHFELIPFLSGILERDLIKEPLRINNLEETRKFGYVKAF